MEDPRLQSKNSPEERNKAIKKLREIIETTKKRLAEIDRLLEIDSLEEELTQKRREFRKTTFGKDAKIKEIASLETKLDQKENPFKWMIVDNISKKNYFVIFESETKSAAVVNKDIFAENMDGTVCEFWDKQPDSIVDKFDNAVMFSSNGFYLRLKNKKELGKDIVIDGPDALYDLVGPSGSNLLVDMTFTEGVRLLKERARRYHSEQLEIFDNQNK